MNGKNAIENHQLPKLRVADVGSQVFESVENGWHTPTKQDKKELKQYLKTTKMKNESELEKLDQNIEASASLYIGKTIYNNLDEKDRIAVNAFKAGVTSASAKEYWYHRFVNAAQ